MTRSSKMPVGILLALTIGPAIAIGMTLWVVNDMVPACAIFQAQRLPSPDAQFDLVTFSRSCGDTPPNIQAALVPPGEQVPFDAASFVSIAAEVDLAPRWDASGNIEITLPENVEILRQDDTVAGLTVTYR